MPGKPAVQSFDVVVIGGGTGGLAVARLCAAKKKTVALAERAHIGGRRLFFSDEPLRELQSISEQIHSIERLKKKGFVFFHAPFTAPLILDAVRNRQLAAAQNEFDETKLAAEGITLFKGPAQFRDKTTIAVNESLLKARHFVIATGSHPGVPALEGLDETGYWTPHSFWELDRIPFSITVLGREKTGLAQALALARLGSNVTIAVGEPTISGELGHFLDKPIARHLSKQNIRVLAGFSAEHSGKTGKLKTISGQHNAVPRSISSDELLIAYPRAPATEGLNLKGAGVKYSDAAIAINDRCQTSTGHIFAIGSVTGYAGYQDLTLYHAQVCANAICQGGLFGKNTLDLARIPHELDLSHAFIRAGWPDGEKKPLANELAFVDWKLPREYRCVIGVDRKKNTVRAIYLWGPNAKLHAHEWLIALRENANLTTFLQTHFPGVSPPVLHTETVEPKPAPAHREMPPPMPAFKTPVLPTTPEKSAWPPLPATAQPPPKNPSPPQAPKKTTPLAPDPPVPTASPARATNALPAIPTPNEKKPISKPNTLQNSHSPYPKGTPAGRQPVRPTQPNPNDAPAFLVNREPQKKGLFAGLKKLFSRPNAPPPYRLLRKNHAEPNTPTPSPTPLAPTPPSSLAPQTAPQNNPRAPPLAPAVNQPAPKINAPTSSSRTLDAETKKTTRPPNAPSPATPSSRKANLIPLKVSAPTKNAPADRNPPNDRATLEPESIENHSDFAPVEPAPMLEDLIDPDMPKLRLIENIERDEKKATAKKTGQNTP